MPKKQKANSRNYNYSNKLNSSNNNPNNINNKRNQSPSKQLPIENIPPQKVEEIPFSLVQTNLKPFLCGVLILLILIIAFILIHDYSRFQKIPFQSPFFTKSIPLAMFTDIFFYNSQKDSHEPPTLFLRFPYIILLLCMYLVITLFGQNPISITSFLILLLD